MYRYVKRFLDLVMTIILLVICLIPMTIIAIAIKIDSKGPVFFKQIRTGKDGKTFMLYKFRSMVADNDVHNFTTENRYTKVGNFVRKTSLDELGQLINVFCY